MSKLLVIVDMQNDFITGSLANKDAAAIVPGICDLIKNWSGDIVCTLDSHPNGYLETQEGTKLPVKHCLRLTSGWLLNKEIREALNDRSFYYAEKETFGSVELGEFCENEDKHYDEVVFVGTCTDICVISNVLTFKAFNPEIPLVVYEDLCAGLTKEKHEAALEVMRSCQVDVRSYDVRKCCE